MCRTMGLTKTGRCWKLCTSFPVGSTDGLSPSTKLTSIRRVTPAAMSVYPNMECTIVLSISAWGCALIAYPVSRITIEGMTFLFGFPSLVLLSQMPTRPAHHHIIPMVVCWRSLCTQGPPHRCSVKVLTQPQTAMIRESKNS